MARCVTLRVLLVVAAVAASVAAAVASRGGDRGGRVARERRVWQVVAEHTDAINACDLRRLMAQHPYVCEEREVRREWGGRASRVG